MDNRFEATVGAGTMRSDSSTAVRFPHRWTPGGVTVEADFTGAHLLHLAAAGLSAEAGRAASGNIARHRRSHDCQCQMRIVPPSMTLTVPVA